MRSSMRCRLLPMACVVTLLLAGSGCGGEGADGSKAGGSGAGGQSAAAEKGSERSKASKGGESSRQGTGASERGGRRGKQGSRGGGRGGRGPGGFGGGGEGDGSRGVPVEVASVGRQTISQFFETHGTLEAENEVDLVARVSGPITELKTEEGRQVKKGQLLARIDDREIKAQLEVARVRVEESRQSYDRIKSLFEKELVARDSYDQAFAALEAAKGDHQRLDIQLAYTQVTAPFSGLVVQRYVKFAEHVQNGARLLRLSDFDPLLCPIQVPERELARLQVGQRAELTVESFAGVRFDARVLRISPIVDSSSGTVKVTIQVSGQGKLRPGMFANVFLEMANRENALVVPKAALALDSLGNTIYVAKNGAAERRDLELGFRNENFLEVLSGAEEGEEIVVVGQDGLSDGTPIEILARADDTEGSADAGADLEVQAEAGVGSSEPGSSEPGSSEPGSSEPGSSEPGQAGPREAELSPGQASSPAVQRVDEERRPIGRPGRDGSGGRGRGFRDLDFDDPEQVERAKSRMRERGMDEAQIEERLERMKERRKQRTEGGGAS